MDGKTQHIVLPRPLGGQIDKPSGSDAMWQVHAKWEIKGNTNCTDWKERPGTGCVRYDKMGDAVDVIDVASGKSRAKIVKTAPGNAEKLAP